MIATLKESKARLSELVRMVGAGQEVLITVRGKPQARLSPVRLPKAKNRSWMDELQKLRSAIPTARKASTALEDARADRL
ncbi:MAG: type II toxin-antitoxin system Phd/YefM family antitoxin [Chthoniobacterales bacterium]